MASQHDSTFESCRAALQNGRPREALALAHTLLEHTKAPDARYNQYLTSAEAAYSMLARTREAGYVLLALRRFAEARRCFTLTDRPVEWALCAVAEGRTGEAARVLVAVGFPMLAISLVGSAMPPAARVEIFEGLLRNADLDERPYERALVGLNLGDALLESGRTDEGNSALMDAAARFESLAQSFTERRHFERAFDCLSCLRRVGVLSNNWSLTHGASERLISSLFASDDSHSLLTHTQELLSLAEQHDDWVTVARVASTFVQHTEQAFARQYWGWFSHKALSAEKRLADTNVARNGMVEITERHLLAAAQHAEKAQLFSRAQSLYARLTALPLNPLVADEYAQRARLLPDHDLPIAPLPSSAERSVPEPSIWIEDLVERETLRDPAILLATMIGNDISPLSRPALLAALCIASPGFDSHSAHCQQTLATHLGKVPGYPVIALLETLFLGGTAPTRTAVIRAAANCRVVRTLRLVIRAVDDPDAAVSDAAVEMIGTLGFRGSVQVLADLATTSPHERARAAACKALGSVQTDRVVDLLLDRLRDETSDHVRSSIEAELFEHGYSGYLTATARARLQNAEGRYRESLQQIIRRSGD